MKRILNKAIYSVLAVCMALYLSACGQVDNGERGLYVVWGETQQDVLSEGVYFYNPFTTSLVTIDTKEKIWTEAITSFSSDVQEVKIIFQLAYYPQRAEIANLYKEFGGDFIDKILPPATYGVIKEVTGRYTAVDLVTKRAEVTSEISKKLQTILEDRKVVVTKFDIVELDFRDEFEKAVEAKVIATQQAEKAKNDTLRIQEEAKQKVIQAEAEARAMAIKSEALSKNKALVEYEAVLKWNGELPQYMMGNSVPFINVGK